MIKVRNLVKVYKSKKQKKCRAIDNISFDLPNKGMIFIIGKSGSGKSTLLNLLGGLDSPTDGEIEVLGNNINKYQENQLYSYRSSLIGFVFQDFHLINDLTVEENVGMSLKLKSEYNPKLISSVLKNVDLANYENRYPNELSGGQKQRVAIARAIVKNPSIVLADEPTGNLDVATAKQILKLLKNISKEKLVIIVSHNLDDAYEYGDRIIELKNGKIKSDLMLKNQTGESVFIENNMLIIPSKRKFEQKELDKILEVCKNQKIESIKQIEEKFVDFNGVKDEEIKEEIQDSNLSFFDTLKFSFIFGKNKAFKLVLSSILLALIISVLSLTQSIKNFDFEEVVKDTVVDNNSIYSIRKSIDGNIGESKLKPITKEDISKFEQIEGNTNVYTLYTEALYVKGQYYVSRLDMPQYNSENIFIQETFGTLVTNEEYAQKLLNVEKLEIYTNDIEYVKGGVYITDYVADAYLHNAVYKNYDEILGIVYENGSTNWLAGYVNGIIITNYRERFKSAIEKLNNLDKKDDEDVEVVKFYDYLRQALAVGYSFEENFLDEASKDVLSKSYWWSHMAFINDVDISDTVPYYSIASYSDILLNDDEVFMDLDTYNRIFNTFYTYNDVDSFVPHKATFNHCDFYGVNCFNKEIIIAKIGKSPISSKILFADNLFQENKKTTTLCYGIYIESDNLTDVIKIAEEQGYVINSIIAESVQSTMKSIEVFKEIFKLITSIVLLICIIIITGFGIKSVRSKIYEIGVMKALGCKLSNFIIIFGLHTLFIALLTIILFVFAYSILSLNANEILLDSLRNMGQVKFLGDIRIIVFELENVFINSITVLTISLISTVIPFLLLYKIKPIKIINSKE